MLSAKTELLEQGSRKFLYRIGARPTGLGGVEGAWNGDFLVNQRLMLEHGNYLPIGELSPRYVHRRIGSKFWLSLIPTSVYLRRSINLKQRHLCRISTRMWFRPGDPHQKLVPERFNYAVLRHHVSLESLYL